MHKEIDTHSACKEDAGIRLRTTRREFLLASFVVPLLLDAGSEAQATNILGRWE